MLAHSTPHRIAAALLAFVLLLPASHAELSQEERQAKTAELTKLRSRIEQVTSQRSAVRSRYDEVQNQLRQTERAIGRQLRKLRALNKKLATHEAKLAALRRHQIRLEKDVRQQRQLLSGQIRTAYIIGRQEYLKLLLNQEDPAALGRTMTYYDYFNRARQKQIEQALATLTELRSVETQIEQQRKQLLALKQTQQTQKRQLQASKRERQQVVTRLSGELKNQDDALKHLREDESQLQNLLHAIEDILTAPDDYRQFASYRGQLSWPVHGKVRNLYGHTRRKGKIKWKGVMIQAQRGSNVYAVARGRIAYADWLRGYGLLVIVDHGDGYMSLYGHNENLLKEVGDWVEADEAIANVGQSGGQKSSALYFEIRHNGRPADPGGWCNRKRRTG